MRMVMTIFRDDDTKYDNMSGIYKFTEEDEQIIFRGQLEKNNAPQGIKEMCDIWTSCNFWMDFLINATLELEKSADENLRGMKKELEEDLKKRLERLAKGKT